MQIRLSYTRLYSNGSELYRDINNEDLYREQGFLPRAYSEPTERSGPLAKPVTKPQNKKNKTKPHSLNF